MSGSERDGVFADLVGQERVVEELRLAVRAAAGVGATGAAPADAAVPGAPARSRSAETGRGMTHAWMFTGPPGSGRSTAALAFAAALQCPDQGCGHCKECHTALIGSHADVDVVRTDALSIGVKETRDLVRRSALTPAGPGWQVIVLEDSDRLTEQAVNVLLKAIEEPPRRTVWLLCVPSTEDLAPTIRSRCRLVVLRTPPAAAVADLLVRRDGINPAMAAYAAAASQGHVGRARRLALDERARLRRQDVLRVPSALQHLPACFTAAANIVEAAAEEAREATGESDAEETRAMRRALGEGPGTRGLARGSAGVIADLERRQKARATRQQRDGLDRALVDLASFYRDVLVVQLGASVELVNEADRPAVEGAARAGTPAATLRRLEAVLACRESLAVAVAPLLAVEALTVELLAG
ncbi:DNA polymerase III subunit delta' [soil metagenome]